MSMGHFINWRFGVPVKVTMREGGYPVEGLLVHEDQNTFTVNNRNTYSKISYTYELIPFTNSPSQSRYPVCQNKDRVAYCNCGEKMNIFSDVLLGNLVRIPEKATITIDGKTIELSRETVDKLKKELGV